MSVNNYTDLEIIISSEISFIAKSRKWFKKKKKKFISTFIGHP